MSFGIVASVGVALLGASASRSAQSQAADANARALEQQNQALEAQKQATNERLEFDKKTYADGQGARDWAFEQARLESTNQQADRTKYNALQDEQIARGRRYQGAEDRMLADAESFDTEGKREELAGKARADVQQGFASANEQRTRQQTRMGVNPNSGRADAMVKEGALALAGGLAFAGTKARSDAMTLGYSRKMDALGLGKGIIGNQATQAGLQLASGNSSVANAGNGINIQNSGSQQMSNGYGNAAQGYGSSAQGYSNLGNNQYNSFVGSHNYGNQYGQAAGNAMGSFLKQPGVTNGLRNMWDSWNNPMTISEYGGGGNNTVGQTSSYDANGNGVSGEYHPSSGY